MRTLVAYVTFFLDLEEIAFSENYDVIDVTESWLIVKDYLAKYKIPSYTIFKKKIRANRKGGSI